MELQESTSFTTNANSNASGYHTKQIEKKIFTKPLLVYKLSSDKALSSTLKIIEYFLGIDTTEKIFVEDLALIKSCVDCPIDWKINMSKTCQNFEKLAEFKLRETKPDLCIVFGGDGTIVWANSIFESEDRPPFLTFNLGTLGYMANYFFENYQKVLDDIFNKKTNLYIEKRSFLKGRIINKEIKPKKMSYSMEFRRSMSQKKSIRKKSLKDIIEVEESNTKEKNNINNSIDTNTNINNNHFHKFASFINQNHIGENMEENYNNLAEGKNPKDKKEKNQTIFALNEFTIERKAHDHMIKTQIFYNEQPLNAIKSNGIILASPTGSTAYSLSAAGTIVHYGVDCFILNSICPHSLSFRPIAFPRGDKLSIMITEDSMDAIVLKDGISCCQLKPNQAVEVEMSDKYVEFLLTEESYEHKSNSWKKKIIDQLGWNSSFKNFEIDENAKGEDLYIEK